MSAHKLTCEQLRKIRFHAKHIIDLEKIGDSEELMLAYELGDFLFNAYTVLVMAEEIMEMRCAEVVLLPERKIKKSGL